MNIDYLARIFKKNTGMTLNDYIINEKMEVARNLLITTKLPVGLIAMKVGYSNFSYFSKLYKKHIIKHRQKREAKPFSFVVILPMKSRYFIIDLFLVVFGKTDSPYCYRYRKRKMIECVHLK